MSSPSNLSDNTEHAPPSAAHVTSSSRPNSPSTRSIASFPSSPRLQDQDQDQDQPSIPGTPSSLTSDLGGLTSSLSSSLFLSGDSSPGPPPPPNLLPFPHDEASVSRTLVMPSLTIPQFNPNDHHLSRGNAIGNVTLWVVGRDLTSARNAAQQLLSSNDDEGEGEEEGDTLVSRVGSWIDVNEYTSSIRASTRSVPLPSRSSRNTKKLSDAPPKPDWNIQLYAVGLDSTSTSTSTSSATVDPSQHIISSIHSAFLMTDSLVSTSTSSYNHHPLLSTLTSPTTALHTALVFLRSTDSPSIDSDDSFIQQFDQHIPVISIPPPTSLESSSRTQLPGPNPPSTTSTSKPTTTSPPITIAIAIAIPSSSSKPKNIQTSSSSTSLDEFRKTILFSPDPEALKNLRTEAAKRFLRWRDSNTDTNTTQPSSSTNTSRSRARGASFGSSSSEERRRRRRRRSPREQGELLAERQRAERQREAEDSYFSTLALDADLGDMPYGPSSYRSSSTLATAMGVGMGMGTGAGAGAGAGRPGLAGMRTVRPGVGVGSGVGGQSPGTSTSTTRRRNTLSSTSYASGYGSGAGTGAVGGSRRRTSEVPEVPERVPLATISSLRASALDMEGDLNLNFELRLERTASVSAGARARGYGPRRAQSSVGQRASGLGLFEPRPGPGPSPVSGLSSISGVGVGAGGRRGANLGRGTGRGRGYPDEGYGESEEDSYDDDDREREVSEADVEVDQRLLLRRAAAAGSTGAAEGPHVVAGERDGVPSAERAEEEEEEEEEDLEARESERDPLHLRSVARLAMSIVPTLLRRYFFPWSSWSSLKGVGRAGRAVVGTGAGAGAGSTTARMITDEKTSNDEHQPRLEVKEEDESRSYPSSKSNSKSKSKPTSGSGPTNADTNTDTNANKSAPRTGTRISWRVFGLGVGVGMALSICLIGIGFVGMAGASASGKM